jgi:putative transposase
MAWTTEDRRRYAPAIREMVRRGMLVRLAATIDAIHPPSPVGRPRLWPTLVMLQALWHVARDDRAWRRLPSGSPPHQTVWSRLQAWRRRAAVLDRALRVLVTCRRLAAGRKRRPTAAIVDTQSVKTGPQRGPRGYDAHKKVKGRKRVLMVDPRGDPLGVRVLPADVQDRARRPAGGPRARSRPARPLLLVWLDRAFAGDGPAIFLRGYGIAAELVGTRGRQGFRVEPRRWKVEQTFGCLQRYRRLRVDDEMSPDTSRQMTVLAAVFMIGMRLERMLR